MEVETQFTALTLDKKWEVQRGEGSSLQLEPPFDLVSSILPSHAARCYAATVKLLQSHALLMVSPPLTPKYLSVWPCLETGPL